MINFTIPGETLHSILPWDVPWWAPDHVIFLGTLYLVLGAIGLGMVWVVIKSLIEASKGGGHH
jgi:hypothetical protein